MRSETFFPKVANRSVYVDWVKEGSKSAWQKANEMAREILAAHHVNPIDQEIVKAIKDAFPYLRDCTHRDSMVNLRQKVSIL